MSENELKDKISESMAALDKENALKLVEKAIAEDFNVLEVVDALRDGLKLIGDDFEKMVRFLPELIKAADIMEEAMGILGPKLDSLQISTGPSASIAVANVQGDIHDIGRNILSAVLRAAGFKVHDLGHDVNADVIIDKAIEKKANIIGLSSLLTTSLPFIEDLIKLLDDRGQRDKFKVVLGGGAVTPEYAKLIGADGYAKDAGAAVNVLNDL